MANSLILNSPYDSPTLHWREERGTLSLAHGPRPAGYEIFDTRQNTRRTQTLDLVNRIRERVAKAETRHHRRVRARRSNRWSRATRWRFAGQMWCGSKPWCGRLWSWSGRRSNR